MAHDERQTALLAETVAWLDAELRGTRDVTLKLARALDQSRTEIRELSGALHAIDDRVAGIVPRLTAIPEVAAQVGDVRDLLARMHDQGQAAEARMTEIARLVDTTAARERAALNDLSHRLDAVERQSGGASARFEGLEESTRRAMEATAQLRAQLDDGLRTIEGLDARLVRAIESGNRTEAEFSRIGSEMEALRRQHEMLADRIHAAAEVVKRVDNRITGVASEAAIKQGVLEAIDLQRVQTHRLEERLAGIETATESLREHAEEMSRQVKLVDGRQSGFMQRLDVLKSEAESAQAAVREQFQRLYALNERLKRLQLEQLERELRELRVHAVHTQEET